MCVSPLPECAKGRRRPPMGAPPFVQRPFATPLVFPSAASERNPRLLGNRGDVNAHSKSGSNRRWTHGNWTARITRFGCANSRTLGGGETCDLASKGGCCERETRPFRDERRPRVLPSDVSDDRGVGSDGNDRRETLDRRRQRIVATSPPAQVPPKGEAEHRVSADTRMNEEAFGRGLRAGRR